MEVVMVMNRRSRIMNMVACSGANFVDDIVVGVGWQMPNGVSVGSVVEE